ncbi:hypothetical protein, partial [Microvirgula aerodenitrificans]
MLQQLAAAIGTGDDGRFAVDQLFAADAVVADAAEAVQRVVGKALRIAEGIAVPDRSALDIEQDLAGAGILAGGGQRAAGQRTQVTEVGRLAAVGQSGITAVEREAGVREGVALDTLVGGFVVSAVVANDANGKETIVVDGDGRG